MSDVLSLTLPKGVSRTRARRRRREPPGGWGILAFWITYAVVCTILCAREFTATGALPPLIAMFGSAFLVAHYIVLWQRGGVGPGQSPMTPYGIPAVLLIVGALTWEIAS